MVVLRSESKATGCSASSLRAGDASARCLRGLRAARLPGHSGLQSRRGPPIAQGRGSYPPARAVPGFLASPTGPARAGAQQARFVGSIRTQGPLVGYGAGLAPCVAFGSNCVFKPTAGAMLVPNRPSLASGGLTRRWAAHCGVT
jgi:hypothetical protein